MFDAARGALLAVSDEAAKAPVKTHRGLIAAFGQHMVLPGHASPEIGAALNKVERLRLNADYTGIEIKAEDASWAVDQAVAAVASLRAKFINDDS
jgi:uncharacterized protein (UPF0332 family)